MDNPASPKLIEPRLLKGFRDIMPESMLIRQQMIEKISRTFTSFGFLPLETPVLEYADILLGKLGDEGEKLLYTFEDHGQRQVAMRYDLTVPLARVVSQYPNLSKPFKRYQIGPVWRADNSQRGRYREFYQCDADIVGTDSPLADAEVLVTVQQVLLQLGVKDFIIRVNDRRIINQIAASLSLDQQQTSGLFKVLDNLEKVDWSVSSENLHKLGLSSHQVDNLKKDLIDDPRPLAEMAPQLATILNHAKSMGLDDVYLKYDPSIVRGLDYYSGMVFETNLTKVSGYGAIFAGGRYDGLVSRFSKQALPAVGASAGIDRLIAALEELHSLPAHQSPTKVVVTLFDDTDRSVQATLQTASRLRQAGLATTMAYQASSIGKQCKQAAENAIPWAVIIGPEEQASNQVSLRNLSTKQEQLLSLDQAIQAIGQD